MLFRSTFKSEETGRASSLFNTHRQVAASVGVAVLTTVLLEQTAAYVVGVTGVAATAQAQLQAFHDAFAASIVFGQVGFFSLCASTTRTRRPRCGHRSRDCCRALCRYALVRDDEARP